MLKSILIIFVMFFGVSINALAENTEQPTPTNWLEDDNNKSFLDETRLKCISVGIKKTTAKEPFNKYLGALALQFRNTPANVNEGSLEGDRADLVRLRFSYLASIVNYISTYGVCHDDKAYSDEDAYKINDKSIAPLKVSISSKLKRKSAKLNELTEIISGEDEYNFLDALFPRTAKVNGEDVIFKNLSAETQKELAIERTKNARKVLNKTWGKNDPFYGCVDELKNYQEEGGVKASKKIIATPRALCTSMMSTCGYPDPDFCKKFDDRRDAPTKHDEQTGNR